MRLTDKDWKNPESLMWTKLGLIPMRNEVYRTSLSEALRKLAHYEDLEEQGRLIELPCAVGDTVYYLAQYAEKGELTDNFFVSELQISCFEFDRQLTIYDLNGIDYILDDIFLTKEEAEAKLKEAGEQE